MHEITARIETERFHGSADSLYEAVVHNMDGAVQDLVERVAGTGVDRMERELNCAGLTWVVTVQTRTDA